MFFFSQVIRWGVEAVCSGVGLGLDFGVAVYIFHVPPRPPIILVMTCHFLVLIEGLGVWTVFSQFGAPCSALAACVVVGVAVSTFLPVLAGGLLLLLPHCQAGSGGW